MATMIDALIALRSHPTGAISLTVAEALWPDGCQSKASKIWIRPHHGGPSGAQRAAAGLLGKMERKGLVYRVPKKDDPRSWWKLSEAGIKAGNGLTPNAEAVRPAFGGSEPAQG